MDVSVHHKPELELGREEGFLHYAAREGRTALRWTVGGCIIAIVLCMVSPGFYFVAVIPALVLLAAFVMLVLANAVERRSDVEAHNVLEKSETAVADDVMDDHAEDDQLAPMDAEIIRKEGITGIAIVAVVMIVAVLIAGFLLDWKVAAIGALVVFAYMLLVAAPLWLGWIEDDIEIESHRKENKPEPAGVRSGEAAQL